jgi:hypothetical protein
VWGIDGGWRWLPRRLGVTARGGGFAGQHVTPGVALGSREASGVVGRRRARAGARAQGGGGNGGARRGAAVAWDGARRGRMTGFK